MATIVPREDNEPAGLDVAAVERMRLRYGIRVTASVVMPGHVHLLVSEPPKVIRVGHSPD